MPVTTIKVDTSTRDQLRSLLRGNDDSYDSLLRRIILAERQRRMAEELAGWEPTPDEQQWLDIAAHDASVGPERPHAAG